MYSSGKWYEIRLPYGKKYSAQYLIENTGSVLEWFCFSDGSRKLAKDITPYAVEIVEIDEPLSTLSIIDFLDDKDEL